MFIIERIHCVPDAAAGNSKEEMDAHPEGGVAGQEKPPPPPTEPTEEEMADAEVRNRTIK